MSQVFLSYAAEDHDTAAVMARALQAHGFSVWWDHQILPGRTFDEVIDAELQAAGCAVVLWSPASVASRWVRAEAGDADARNVLIPAIIEPCQIPLPFRQIQSANLIGWRGAWHHPGFEALIGVISNHLGGAQHRAAPPPPPPRADTRKDQAGQPRPGRSPQPRAPAAPPPSVTVREEPPASVFRSIVAVLVGFAVMVALTLAAGPLVSRWNAQGSLFSLGIMGLIKTTALWMVLQTGSCWLAAQLAPRRPMHHALVLGTIVQVLELLLIGGSFAEQPLYTLLPFLVAIPSACAGGWLGQKQLIRRGRSQNLGHGGIKKG